MHGIGLELRYYNIYNMEAKWIHKIIGIGTSFGIVLPAKMLSSLHLRKGDAVVIYISDSTGIKVTPLNDYLIQTGKTKERIIKL